MSAFTEKLNCSENSKVTCQSQLLIQQPTLLLSLLLLIVSCSSESEKQNDENPDVLVSHKPVQIKGCLGCHAMKLDALHDIACTECHSGNNESFDKDISHDGMIAKPAHPDNMMASCGKCHASQVKDSLHSLHFTLKNEINLVRSAFGAKEELEKLTDIPSGESPVTLLDLSDDLLRRRCLRCHVYTAGDSYPATARGTGCASCHLSFYEGKLQSHTFLKTPGDRQCLQCHYGNHVGFDYYGRFEHDMNEEYRTPYTTTNDYFRPFGLEYHQLSPDVHQKQGMICVDCHAGTELMGKTNVHLDCASCHDASRLAQTIPTNIIKNSAGTYILTSAKDEKTYIVPLLKHPAHQKYEHTAGCQVCHAQWAFNDEQTHLLRSDTDEYDDFSRLTVQGSFEVEQVLENNLDFDADEIEPQMTDKISGELQPGLWHKGYVSRRWEDVKIGRDTAGKLQIMRPALDLYLSWIDSDHNVRFDSVPARTKDGGMLPYTPHTTGKAGLFYENRIENFLRSEKDEQR